MTAAAISPSVVITATAIETSPVVSDTASSLPACVLRDTTSAAAVSGCSAGVTLGLIMAVPTSQDHFEVPCLPRRLRRSTVEVVAEEPGPSLRWATATTTTATRDQS